MKKVLFILMIIIVLSACGKSDDSTNNADDEMIKPIDAALDVPEKSDVNKPVEFSVAVTQEEKAVDDADEVEFEVWKDGAKSDSEMIEGTQDENGVYTAKKTFKENGIYYIQSHVTARGMHTMPKTKIIVCKVDENATSTEK